jgi:hypothetical protein
VLERLQDTHYQGGHAVRAGPSSDRRSMNVEELEKLVKRAGVRTADRANMQRMLKKMKAGQALTTQERETCGRT